MHEIAWPIIGSSSVISAIILCAEEIKPSQCKLQYGQLSINKEKIPLYSNEGPQEKTLGNFNFVICDFAPHAPRCDTSSDLAQVSKRHYPLCL